MSQSFDELLRMADLDLEEAAEILMLPVEILAEYKSGTRLPSVRAIQILRGLSICQQLKIVGHAKQGSEVIRCTEGKRAMRKSSKKKSSAVLSSLELCAGAGGAALGLEAAGFEPKALIELDKHACATLRQNRPYWNVIQADVRYFESDYWRGVDLLSGGLPCPPFSIAGKQLGPDDERDLFPAMLKVVKSVQPRAILIENVRGILTDRFAFYRRKIDAALDRQGFDTYWTEFNAANFGVPQNRFRAFLVALRRGETKPLKWPIEFSDRVVTVADAIGDLISERGWKGAKAWKDMASLPAPTIVGGSHKHGGPDLGPTRARREWATLGVDGLGIADLPPAEDFIGMPRLTVPMVARLQSFPNEWKFVGGKTQTYRQVGNALPVKLAESVAKAVRSCLL